MSAATLAWYHIPVFAPLLPPPPEKPLWQEMNRHTDNDTPPAEGETGWF